MTPVQTSGLCGVSAALAMRLARACVESYDLRLTDGVVRNVGWDLRARVQDDGDKIIVAIRGTASLRDWEIDLYAIPNTMGIHTGGYNAWQALRPGALAEIASKQDIRLPKPVYVCGHSLGGMIGAIGIDDIPGAAMLVTFGEPRNKTKKASQSKVPHVRFVDKEDIVTHVPGLLAGYRHRGDLILFDCLGGVEINPPVWRQLLMHALGLEADFQRIACGKMPEWVAVREHFMRQYLNAVAALPA